MPFYPTPTGQAPASQQLTTLAWQDQPTTDQSEAQAIAIVTKAYGAKVGTAFKKWYDAARKKDPKITPNQAAVVFLVGYDVATGTGKTASFLTGSPYKVSNPATGTISSGSEGPGVAQAAANAAESLYRPGGGSDACALHVPSFWLFPGWCIMSKTALRATIGGLVLAGAGLMGITSVIVLAAYGLGHTSSGRALTSSAKAVGKVAPFIGA